MTKLERDKLIGFCVYARAENEGVCEEVVWADDADKLEALTDE